MGALVEWVLGVRGAIPVLLRLLLGLGFSLDLWGSSGTSFAPVLACSSLAIIVSGTSSKHLVFRSLLGRR